MLGSGPPYAKVSIVHAGNLDYCTYLAVHALDEGSNVGRSARGEKKSSGNGPVHDGSCDLMMDDRPGEQDGPSA